MSSGICPASFPEVCACAVPAPAACHAPHPVPTLNEWCGIVMIICLLVIGIGAAIERQRSARRQPPTTNQPRPGITDARICPTTDYACRRDCAGRCWHEIGP